MRYFIIYYSICIVMIIGLLPLAYMNMIMPNVCADLIALEIGLLGGIIATIMARDINNMLR